MAITWGSTTLSVVAGTWQPYVSGNAFSEVPLLPDPLAPTAVNTVLQQSGRERYRVRGTLILASMSAYTTLLGDKNAGTARTLADGSVNASYYIESIKPPKYDPPNFYTAEIVFVEV
jgi:hypothetical protein